MVRPAGLEPATPGLGNRCSILLSYGRVAKTAYFTARRVRRLDAACDHHNRSTLCFSPASLRAPSSATSSIRNATPSTSRPALHQIDRRTRGAARGEQVVDDQHALPGLDRVPVHLEAVGAVLELVARPDGCRRQFPELPHRHEPGAEPIRDGAPRMNPRLSMPTTRSMPAPENGGARLSIASRNPSGSRSSVVTS